MERLITISYQDNHGLECKGDAIVEYTRYNEDGAIINEILRIYLPEYVDEWLVPTLKERVAEAFHNGEGYNL